MPAFYNEIDRHAAQWLRNLAQAKLIAPGHIEEKSIVDLKAKDLEGYERAHFFAGIGGWDYALQLAGWPKDAQVWTGSCPCQPFSAAGKRQGTKDPRHLWPDFARLIEAGRPSVVFGEQVASKDGREWLSGVRADLERMGYEVGSADLCAAGIGAPHIRQRLYWVGYSRSRGLAYPTEQGRQGCPSHRGRAVQEADPKEQVVQSKRHGDAGGTGHFARFDLIPCKDGKARRIESGTFPLAYGVPGRVGLLRGYGNAIVPQVAAEFIKSVIPYILEGAK